MTRQYTEQELDLAEAWLLETVQKRIAENNELRLKMGLPAYHVDALREKHYEWHIFNMLQQLRAKQIAPKRKYTKRSPT